MFVPGGVDSNLGRCVFICTDTGIVIQAGTCTLKLPDKTGIAMVDRGGTLLSGHSFSPPKSDFVLLSDAADEDWEPLWMESSFRTCGAAHTGSGR